jgi:hypothetical protein
VKKKHIIILILIPLGLYLFWTSYAWSFFSCGIAGSYPCVETWSLEVKEKDLIEIMKEIKVENPELSPPNYSKQSDKKHRYWYNFTFYYQNTNENVQTWIRGNENSEHTTLALVATYTHTDTLSSVDDMVKAHGSRKEINRDYNYFETDFTKPIPFFD